MDAEGRLPLPLGSVRLLLSPSDAEDDLPKVPECTWKNFSDEAEAWRKAAARNDKNLTFFYYTGHGLQLPPARSILLMSDFGGPGGAELEYAVELDHVMQGMVPPSAALGQIARTQFYFVDACRTPAVELSDLEPAHKIWKTPPAGADDRTRPVYFGAPPGVAANALPGKQTLFSEALMECFDGLAAIGPEGNDPRWLLTSLSLTEGLKVAIERVNKKYEEKGAKQSFQPLPSDKATLLYFNEPPLVEVEFKIEPDAAVQLFKVDVADDEANPLFSIDPIAPHPHIRKLRAGQYIFRAQLLNGPHPVYRSRTKALPVKPPTVPWTAKVSP